MHEHYPDGLFFPADRLHPRQHPAAGQEWVGHRAQREAIAGFAETEGLELIGEHVEVETGKGADALDRRPALAAALAARKRRAA